MFVTCQQQTLIILSLVLNKLKEMGARLFSFSIHLRTLFKKNFHKNMDHMTHYLRNSIQYFPTYGLKIKKWTMVVVDQNHIWV